MPMSCEMMCCLNTIPAVLSERQLKLFADCAAGLESMIRSPGLDSHFFQVSVSGYYGICPSALAVGNKVAVFRVGKTPRVLRADGNSHILVGWD